MISIESSVGLSNNWMLLLFGNHWKFKREIDSIWVRPCHAHHYYSDRSQYLTVFECWIYNLWETGNCTHKYLFNHRKPHKSNIIYETRYAIYDVRYAMITHIWASHFSHNLWWSSSFVNCSNISCFVFSLSRDRTSE